MDIKIRNKFIEIKNCLSDWFVIFVICGNVVYRVEKLYVDKLVARNPLHFNLLSTSQEFLIDQNQYLFEKRYK